MWDEVLQNTNAWLGFGGICSSFLFSTEIHRKTLFLLTLHTGERRKLEAWPAKAAAAAISADYAHILSHYLLVRDYFLSFKSWTLGDVNGQIFTMIFEVKCLRQISQMRHLRGVVILFILRQVEKVSIFWLFRMGRCSSTIICGGQSASSISLYSKTTTMSQSGLWSLLGLSRCFWRVTSRGYCTCWQLENSPVIGTLINEPKKKKKKKESMLCIINIILSCSWLKLMRWWLLKDEMKAVKSTA